MFGPAFRRAPTFCSRFSPKSASMKAVQSSCFHASADASSFCLSDDYLIAEAALLRFQGRVHYLCRYACVALFPREGGLLRRSAVRREGRAKCLEHERLP